MKMISSLLVILLSNFIRPTNNNDALVIEHKDFLSTMHYIDAIDPVPASIGTVRSDISRGLDRKKMIPQNYGDEIFYADTIDIYILNGYLDYVIDSFLEYVSSDKGEYLLSVPNDVDYGSKKYLEQVLNVKKRINKLVSECNKKKNTSDAHCGLVERWVHYKLIKQKNIFIINREILYYYWE